MPYPRENLLIAAAAPVENKAAIATTTSPEANMRQRVVKVIFSYSATPTGGKLTITDGTLTIEHDIAASGVVELEPNVQFTAGVPVKATLAAGGAAVLGKITLIYTID